MWKKNKNIEASELMSNKILHNTKSEAIFIAIKNRRMKLLYSLANNGKISENFDAKLSFQHTSIVSGLSSKFSFQMMLM